MTNKFFNSIPKYFFPLLSTLVYIGLFWAFHSTLGGGLYTLAIFPAAITSWYYGIRAGIIWGFLFFLSNLVMIIVFDINTLHKEFFLYSIPGSFSIFIGVLITGWIRNLNLKLK